MRSTITRAWDMRGVRWQYCCWSYMRLELETKVKRWFAKFPQSRRSGGLLRDYKPSDGPSFQALLEMQLWPQQTNLHLPCIIDTHLIVVTRNHAEEISEAGLITGMEECWRKEENIRLNSLFTWDPWRLRYILFAGHWRAEVDFEPEIG